MKYLILLFLAGKCIAQGIDPLTDICTNCPDPTPTPPVGFTNGFWFPLGCTIVQSSEKTTEYLEWQTTTGNPYNTDETNWTPVVAFAMNTTNPVPVYPIFHCTAGQQFFRTVGKSTP